MTVGVLTVRALEALDLPSAWRLIAQLREQLSAEEFCRRVSRQRELGYMLFGAFDRSFLRGVIGMRIAATLARGEHLHIDDLVVDIPFRSSGIGRVLMDFAEAWATDHGCQSVFLDSRPEVLPFYSRLGYEPHTATLVRKRVTSAQ